MFEEGKIEVTVHSHDSLGFVVRISASINGRTRTAKWPVDEFDEAEAVAVSVRDYVAGGGDVEILLPDVEEEDQQ